MDENPYRGSDSGDVSSPPKPKRGLRFAVLYLSIFLGVVGLLICLSLPARRTAPEAARRNQCMNNLKQIAVALQNYAKEHGALPPAYTTDADGKPLHSWRTLILPYLDEQQLYETIDLTKPWDDRANMEAGNIRLSVYQCPAGSERLDYTTYLAVVTPSSCLASEPRDLAEITDGERETLMVLEVDSEHAVPWMSPVDADEKVVLDIGPTSKLDHTYGVNAAFVDGSVRFLSVDTPAAQRRALISIAGGDKADVDGAE